MKEELFTTTELTSFGKYLLSPERAKHILNGEIEGDPLELLREVHHADFENWKAIHGEAGVDIPVDGFGWNGGTLVYPSIFQPKTDVTTAGSTPFFQTTT